MSVVIETTLGDITVDLFVEDRPRTCLNFLKLCKLKYYNFNLFHTIQHDFIAQTGDPTGSGHSGSSIWGVVEGVHKRYFEAERLPKIRHSEVGLISMVSSEDHHIGSQFFFTLGADLISLDDRHCVFGEVVEGFDVLRQFNEVICDEKHRPYKDVRVTHTVILEDPFDNPRGFREPSRSPSPTAERMQGGRIAADEEIDDAEGKTEAEINEMLQAQEAKARATILEIVGDLPDADVAPPENVLFVCKLNPVTSDDDLEIIFSRFGKIKGCEVIRDKQSGDSLQYAFIEFEDQKSCEDAYFKMDNVLIDDRRIHVDFSQSVSKMRWRGKGKGFIDVDEKEDGAGKQDKWEGKRRNNERPNNRERAQEWHRNGSPRRDNYHRQRDRSNGQERRCSRSPVRNRPSPRRENDLARRRERSPRRNSPARRNRSPQRDRSPRRDRSQERRRDWPSQRDRRQEVSPRRNPPQRRDKSRENQRRRDQSPSRYDNERQRRPQERPDRERGEVVAKRPRPEKPRSRSKSSSSSSTSATSSDDEDSRSRRKESQKKQKRNKTKKSKKSRTSSDDSSSSDSEDSRRRHKNKKRKNKKKKHKKAH